MSRYALFLGCTTPVHVVQYEVAARWVCERLGIDLVDSTDFICCGFSQIDLDGEGALQLAAVNLAQASRMGLDILSLCPTCTGVLADAAQKLEDETVREAVNDRLRALDLAYEGGVRVRHFSHVLYEEIEGAGRALELARDLSGIRIAPHYGCHTLRPEAILDGPDDPDAPFTLHRLIALTGAEPVDYETLTLCCGGKAFPVAKDISFALVRKKLQNLTEREVDALVVQCPTCYLMYGTMQDEVNKKYGTQYRIGTLLYPQLLGLALGADPETDLALDLNETSLDRLLSRLD